MSRDRTRSIAGRLTRLGFADPARAERELGDSLLAGLHGSPDPLDGPLTAELAATADPDLALAGLLRLLAVSPEHDRGIDGLPSALRVDARLRQRTLAVLGSSAALGEHLVRHPEHWPALLEDVPESASQRGALLHAVGADPEAETPTTTGGGLPAYDRLRVGYRRALLTIAAADLASADPLSVLPVVAEQLADLAAAALEAALAIARTEVGEPAVDCRFAVIAMGKCGGRELNYVSDVDVIFVAEPAGPPAQQLATALMRACSAATSEGTLWPVDANLRPEGRNGPLVRSLASHRAYYDRWAKTWEFQALLKARPVAGDQDLGAQYAEAIGELVWHAAERPDFVPDVQAMRRRVEQHVDPAEAERQLKLGPGGLRDVEFSVQLLQLVHGRTDDSVRSPRTLVALAALARRGYVGRDDAAALDGAYRLLRTLEHRIQLFRLRRTHLMPTASDDLRRLGRQLGHRADPDQAVLAQWRAQAREVRRLHQRLFYRPLLAAVARLSTDEVRMTPQAASARLQALGYQDPAGALRHLAALTDGVSRRAAIQRQLLPVMLEWFADEADPDAGLLAFRRVSDELGATHWYLKMLRDDGSAAERLAHVLARSRFAGDLLGRAPETVQLLGRDGGLHPRGRSTLQTEVLAAIARHDDPAKAVAAARALRRRELFRIATADLLGTLRLDDVERALSDVAAAVLGGVLAVATRVVVEEQGEPLGTQLLVVAMGRFGGLELGYGSDADVLFVHDPVGDDASGSERAQRQALAVVTELRRLMAGPGPDPVLHLDADLRPEGRQGPLVRSLASYAAYYQRWSLVWEAQALLRAMPIAGDAGLGERFRALIDPLRWPVAGLSPSQVREVRRVKARIESERLPRGGDPGLHLKLGRGGLSDVEWTVQLLQLHHAGRVPGLQHTGTLTALGVAREAGLIGSDDARVLAEAWTLASRLRNAAVLWRGRPVDALPSDVRDLDGVGRVVGYPPGSAALLIDDYRRTTRRARAAVERVFYRESG